MDAAENTAISSQDEALENFEYYNAKCLTMDEDPCTNESLKADVTPNPHFWNLEVNTSFSAVHVPTNVYDRGFFINEEKMHSYKLLSAQDNLFL